MPAPTPTPATPTAVNPQVDGSDNPIYVEMPDSGIWVVNRTFRVTLKYRIFPYSYAFDNYLFYRGDIVLVGSATYIISESRMKKLKGGYAEIEVDCDSYDQTPTDEVSLDPVEQNPRIERHPIFRPLSTNDFAIIQQAFLALTSGQIQNATNQFVNTSNPQLAQKLYDKLRQGMETYYLSQWRYTWTTYVQNELFENEIILAPPALALGAVTQTPGGPLGPFLAGAQWLREADRLCTQGQSPLGTILKLTRSWLGGPLSFVDRDVYPPG